LKYELISGTSVTSEMKAVFEPKLEC